MRIRTFAAATTRDAMALVRAELGEAAVIIAIDETANGRGVIVRAAADASRQAAEPSVHAPLTIEERLEALLAASLRSAHPAVRRAA